MAIVLEAFFLGLFLMLFVGPSFFYLIKVGIEKGFVPAAFFALGIILSDLLMIILIIFGFSHFFNNLLFKESFSFLAGIIILGLGILSLIKPQGRAVTGKVKDLPNYKYCIRGFGINIVNPFSFMVWMAVLGGVSINRDFTTQQYFIFIAVLLFTVLVADLSKAFGANAIGKFMNEKVVQLVNRALGVTFIFLGIRMIFFFYKLLESGNQTLEINLF